MKSLVCIAAALCLLLAGCGGTAPDGDTAAPQTTPQEGSAVPTGPYTTDTPIQTVMDDPVFGDYGRLLFPADTGVLERGHLGRPPPDLVPQHRPGGDRGHCQPPPHPGRSRGDGVLRHLHPRGKGRRPGQGGYRPLLLPGGTPGQGGLLQRRRRLLPTWGPCRTASPTPWSSPAGGVQCLCPPLPPRSPDRLRGSGPGHHLRL